MIENRHLARLDLSAHVVDEPNALLPIAQRGSGEA